MVNGDEIGAKRHYVWRSFSLFPFVTLNPSPPPDTYAQFLPYTHKSSFLLLSFRQNLETSRILKYFFKYLLLSKCKTCRSFLN